jgi:tRNA (uracil-5-)-methyltransferase TRM9
MSIDTVKEFYDVNGEEFSKTRNAPWPITRQFIESLPPAIRVLDVGCGNGRNMFVRDDLVMTGLELSKTLCEIARERGALVLHGSMTDIPFFDNTFDVIMAIASYHHLSTDYDRQQTIYEFMRVLKSNGFVYIHVWAMEQPKRSKRRFTKRDEIVPWVNMDGRMFMRYYRIYKEGDLQEEIERLSSGKLACVSMNYQEGNWIGLFQYIL